MRNALAASVGLLAVSASCALSSRPRSTHQAAVPEELRVRRITIVDSNGRPRASFGMSRTQGDQPDFVLYDRNGVERMWIGLSGSKANRLV